MHPFRMARARGSHKPGVLDLRGQRPRDVDRSRKGAGPLPPARSAANLSTSDVHMGGKEDGPPAGDPVVEGGTGPGDPTSGDTQHYPNADHGARLEAFRIWVESIQAWKLTGGIGSLSDPCPLCGAVCRLVYRGLVLFERHHDFDAHGGSPWPEMRSSSSTSSPP